MKKALVIAVCFLLAGAFFTNLNQALAQEQADVQAEETISSFDVTQDTLLARWQVNFIGSKYVYGSIGKKPVSFNEVMYVNVTEAEIVDDPLTGAMMIMATGLAYSDQAMQNVEGDILIKRYQGFENSRFTISIYRDIGDDLCIYSSNVFFVPATTGKKAKPDILVGSVARLLTAFDPTTGSNIIFKEISWGMATFTKY